MHSPHLSSLSSRYANPPTVQFPLHLTLQAAQIQNITNPRTYTPMAAVSSSSWNLRSSSSLPNRLFCSFNLLHFTLSSASLAPILLLRWPPTPFGWALLTVCIASLLSSLLAFFAHSARLCFVSHASVAAAAIAGQVLSLLALFLQPEPCLELLSPASGMKNARVLEKIKAVILSGMLGTQAVTMVMACALQSRWETEHRGVEKEKKVVARRRSKRVAMENEEALAGAVGVADEERRELEERMRSKWEKIEFEA